MLGLRAETPPPGPLARLLAKCVRTDAKPQLAVHSLAVLPGARLVPHLLCRRTAGRSQQNEAGLVGVLTLKTEAFLQPAPLTSAHRELVSMVI